MAVILAIAGTLSGCAQSEPSVSPGAMETITAFSGPNGVTSDGEELAGSTDELAQQSEIVVQGEVTAVADGRQGTDSTSLILSIAGTDAEGTAADLRVELWPSIGVTTDAARATIPVGTSTVAYLTRAVTQTVEGAAVVPSDPDLLTPTNRQGLVLSGFEEGGRGNPVEIVWPMMGFSSTVSSLDEAMPGGPAVGKP